MPVMWNAIAAAVFGLVVLVGPALARGAGPTLLPNVGFETDADKDGAPDGWPAATAGTDVRWVTEAGNRFLRLHATEPGKMISVFQAVPVAPGHKAYELTYRVRHDGIKPGAKAWFDGRIMLNFKDADGRTLAGPAAPYYRGSSKGEWKPASHKFLVPEGARKLEFMPALFQVESGTIDFDDFAVRAIDPASIPKKVDMTSPVVPAPPADKLPRALRVDGNQLRDADGNPVWLQGLSVDSLQWSATGERIVPSIGVAIDGWKANCIRLAVKEDFWFGKTEHQSDGGARYRQVIDSAINAAAGRGAYLVIDLHRFRAPEQVHADFWRDVAETYKNHPAVLFELFNEPHGIDWTTWRDGGEVTDKVKPKAGVAAENDEVLRRFHSVGMQRLVDVVRETGAKNVVIVGGLDWSYDLSGILEGYAVEDRGGNGVMYSTHVYPWKSDWADKFLKAAERYPLFIGEVGCPEKWEDFAFIPPAQRKEKLGPGATWSQDMLGTIQKHRLNWTGFSFHPRCGPMVIKDWDYTPTPYWGTFVKDALAGKRFEVERLR
jgi:hypothetical protein